MTAPTGTSEIANPAALFYGANPVVRAVGLAIRTMHRVSPSLGTRSAVGLFLTPIPWKLASEKPAAGEWREERWPFEGAHLSVYRRRESSTDRPTVLLLHGWSGYASQLTTIGARLHDEGFAPVILEFPAHGRSGRWRSNVAQFARAIFAAAGRLGPLHGVVAHSLGTLALTHAVARGLSAERLVLVAPAAPGLTFLRWFAEVIGMDPELGERMRRRIERHESVDFEHFEPEWVGPRVRQPTLVVHDTKDRVVPMAIAERLHAALANSRLHQTTGLGHQRVLHDASVTEAIAAHLRRD